MARWHVVDFDNGLNAAINKLRDALGDSSANPRFIETLPRHGYRFIAPVTSDEQEQAAAAVPRKQNRKLAMLLSLLVIAGLLSAALIWRWRQAPRLTDKDTVVLGEFANWTGDPVFDRTLRQGLSVQLEQSPFLKLVSEEQIRQTLRMMGRQPNTLLTPEVVREVCRRTNSAAALEGSIILIGTRYDLILRAVDCADGDVLASAQAQANDKSQVLDALGQMESEIRKRLGESLGTVQKYNTPLAQATTPSLEALQSYTLGLEAETRTGNFAEALPFFQRAIELDPNFAMAYSTMSEAYSTTGEMASSARCIRKAFDLRSGVSDLEKSLIEGDYYFYGAGDLAEARHSFELTSKLYPRNAYVHDVLAALSNMLGQYDEGLKEYQEDLRLNPFSAIIHRHVIYTYLLSNRVEDAAAAAKEAHAQGLDSNLAPVLYGIAFYRDDRAEMARQVASATGKAGEEDLLLAMDADTDAYFGHLEKARELSRRAAGSAEQDGEKETAASYSAVSALREALYGNAHKARQEAAAAKVHSDGRDVEYGLALALAYAGDTAHAQALVDDLAKRFAEDTIVRFNYLPVLRAKLALDRSNPQRAIAVLGVAAPYEMGLPAYSFYNWPNLYPVYLHGEACLAAHQGREAAAEFQKILDHRNIVLNEPIGVLAHLQVGRAFAMQGDTTKARAAYQDFFTIWRDADPDIPILREAKAEYAKLH